MAIHEYEVGGLGIPIPQHRCSHYVAIDIKSNEPRLLPVSHASQVWSLLRGESEDTESIALGLFVSSGHENRKPYSRIGSTPMGARQGGTKRLSPPPLLTSTQLFGTTSDSRDCRGWAQTGITDAEVVGRRFARLVCAFD